MIEDGKVVVRRRIQATREELFDAWTDAEGMSHWMCPGDVISAEVKIEPRVGGSLLIIMRNPKESFEHRGEFRVFDRPSKLVFTWTAKNLPPTLVTVDFVELSATESELVLIHEEFADKAVRDQYQGGWGKIAAELESYLGRRNG
jgi:uncharacterized protein YndB with AHSA1/START domain